MFVFVLGLLILCESAPTALSQPKKTVPAAIGGPFQIGSHPGDYDFVIGAMSATKKPQIVPVVVDKELFIAWQSWDKTHPTGGVSIVKAPIAKLVEGKLTAVRTVPSGGTLVGFTVDDAGTDYVLTAKNEDFPNQPKGDFVEAIHSKWREGVVNLYTKGEKKDLNGKEYTDATFYGLCNAGTGRLLVGGGHLGAVFSRRHYTPSDGLIHQEANAFLATSDLSKVPLKAGNSVSHSFDQRLIFDGQDFVAIHQGDQYPATGLIIEKIRTASTSKPSAVRTVAFSCPTFANSVMFELGGLATEKDGYPVLFTSTRNTKSVDDKSAQAIRNAPWDLAMVFVVRGFDKKPIPKNPYEIVGSGILAKGYAEPEKFTMSNFSWDPKASSFSKAEERNINRQVAWLTEFGKNKNETRKATSAKLVKLDDGKYLALWEEHVLSGMQWNYARTCGATVTITGDVDNKQIKRGPVVPLPPLRLHRGDDPVTLVLNGVPHAAWVSGGATDKQLILHTVSESLKHKTQILRMP